MCGKWKLIDVSNKLHLEILRLYDKGRVDVFDLTWDPVSKRITCGVFFSFKKRMKRLCILFSYDFGYCY